MDKVVANSAEAAADIGPGSSLAVGGYNLSGIPVVRIAALQEQGAHDLSVMSNNYGLDGGGQGVLPGRGRIARLTASSAGKKEKYERRFPIGELEIMPQRTLAKRLRAGGRGIPAFYTPAGAATQVAVGGLPLRHASEG